MIHKLMILLLFAASILLSGCLRVTQQLRNDQLGMREQILSLYDYQILHNLVRASRGLPMLHVDYTEITGNIDQTLSGEAYWGDSSTLNFEEAVTGGILGSVSNTVQKVWRITGKASQTKKLNITAKPRLKHPEIYRVYVKYAGIQDFLMEEGKQKHESRAAAEKRLKQAALVLLYDKPRERFYYIEDTESSRKNFGELGLRVMFKSPE